MSEPTKPALTKAHINAILIAFVVFIVYLALKLSPIGGQVGALVVNKALEFYDKLPLALAALALGWILGKRKRNADG